MNWLGGFHFLSKINFYFSCPGAWGKSYCLFASMNDNTSSKSSAAFPNSSTDFSSSCSLEPALLVSSAISEVIEPIALYVKSITESFFVYLMSVCHIDPA